MKFDFKVDLAPALFVCLALVLLKHFKIINWSWWIVFSPLLVTLAIGLIALIIIAIVYLRNK